MNYVHEWIKNDKEKDIKEINESLDETGGYQSDECKDCPQGQYGTDVGMTAASSCKNCTIGTYSSEKGKTVCRECGVGRYNPCWLTGTRP